MDVIHLDTIMSINVLPPGSKRVAASLSLRAHQVSSSAASSASAAPAALSTPVLGDGGGFNGGGVGVGPAPTTPVGPIVNTTTALQCVYVKERKFKIHAGGAVLKALIDNKSLVVAGSPIYVKVEAVDAEDPTYGADAFLGLAIKPAHLYSRKDRKAAKKAAASSTDDNEVQPDARYMFILKLADSLGEIGVHVIEVESVKFHDAQTSKFNLFAKFDDDAIMNDEPAPGTSHAVYFETPDITKFGDDVAPEPEEADDDDSSDSDDDKPKKKKKTTVKEDCVDIVIIADAVVLVVDPVPSLNLVGGSPTE